MKKGYGLFVWVYVVATLIVWGLYFFELVTDIRLTTLPGHITPNHLVIATAATFVLLSLPFIGRRKPKSPSQRQSPRQTARKRPTSTVAEPSSPLYVEPQFSTSSHNKDLKGKSMALERTFSIIKPDATARNITGKIIDKLEEGGLRVVAQKRIHMTKEQAEGFYGVHKERPFFNDLVAFMTSEPVVVQVLEGENAIARNREIMGATNPADAAEGTIRKLFAENIERNSVHGSDAPETAKEEIAFFFTEAEIVG